MSKSQLPPFDQGKSFERRVLGVYRRGGGGAPPCRMAQSVLTVILKLVMLWSDQRHLDGFNVVIFNSRVGFVPISLKPVLRIVAAYVMGIVWSSCS